jgi:hypothetical protein
MSGAARRLIPLLDRVLVEKVQAATKSAGGLLLPETAVSKVRLPMHQGHQDVLLPSLLDHSIP